MYKCLIFHPGISKPSLAATNHLRLSVSDGGSGGGAPYFKGIQIVSDTKVAGAESVVGGRGEGEEGHRRLSSKLEHRQGPKPELEVNEEADAADSRSQSDKCIRIENRDFPSHQIYRGL